MKTDSFTFPTASRRLGRVLWTVATVLVVVLSLILGYYFFCLPNFKEEPARQRIGSGRVVVDRRDDILRIVPDKQDRLGLWVSNDAIPHSLTSAVIAAEDETFLLSSRI